MGRPDTGALLIVEDSDEDYALTLWALQRAGVVRPIRRATGVEEALALLCPDGQGAPRASPSFGLVLLDLNLPDGTGLDLLSALRAQHAQTLPVPVVILTTSGNPRDVDRFYGLGVAGYLIKPLDRDDFAGQIRVFADYWLKTVTLPAPFKPVAARHA